MNTQEPYKTLRRVIDEAEAITLLTHKNPDADTLGTALGIYALLKPRFLKRIEVVNCDKALPKEVDFLVDFEKIKSKIEFDESLIICCDGGSVERFGFSLEGRRVVNIDHHLTNTSYGMLNIVNPLAASASQVAFDAFSRLYPIGKESATAWYTALLSDTQNFTTSSVNAEVFSLASTLIEKGADASYIASMLRQRKPLSGVRLLALALQTLRLHKEGRVASVYVSEEMFEATGATLLESEGIVEYARDLVTVEVAIFVREVAEGFRVSLRSKEVDISQVAMLFGGGGHRFASGFTYERAEESMDSFIETILEKIETVGILNETKK